MSMYICTLYFRILTGFAGGAFVSAAPAYTAETAEQRSIISPCFKYNKVCLIDVIKEWAIFCFAYELTRVRV